LWPLTSCFELFAPKPISGYWVYGFEASYFVSSLKEIDSQQHKLGSWLFYSDDIQSTLEAIPNDGKLRVFKVRFEGVTPDMLGVPIAMFGKSYYLKRILELQEINDPFRDFN
jgi:hypothetical protein